MAAKWWMIKKRIPNNLSKKSDWVSKWVIWACTEATEGFSLGIETFIRKFCYLSDGSFIPVYKVVVEIHKNRPRWVHIPSPFEGLKLSQSFEGTSSQFWRRFWAQTLVTAFNNPPKTILSIQSKLNFSNAMLCCF